METPLAVCDLYPGQNRCGNGQGTLWLGQSPAFGTLEAGESLPISLIFDSGVVTQTGVYTASVLFNGSFVNEVEPLTVVMTVAEPAVTIDLSVTVSTDNDCGTSSSLSVPAGTAVYYCYTVVNSGNIPLPSHVISDTVFGHIATFTYPLQPGEVESIIFEQMITAATISTVTWLAAHDGIGRSATAEATAAVRLGDAPVMIYLPLIIQP